MRNIDVSKVAELVNGSNDPTVREMLVTVDLFDVPSLSLLPGQVLRGAAGESRSLTFTAGLDGIQLTSDNSVRDLTILVSADKRAVWNDYSIEDVGTLTLTQVSCSGQVQILARERVKAGHVEVFGLDILSADTRALKDRPREYGVSVLQGAFTLWNMQPDEDIVISANLVGVSVGRAGLPVLGSGVFVSGFGEGGGHLNVARLETGAVYSNGMIPPGTPDQISSGVFVVYGTVADLVRNNGPVTTYGANDMALDNWGTVDRWISLDKVTTFGPSGIGFVNFGTIGLLKVAAPIETHGEGARGFNVYSGTVLRGEFDRIVTRGDGAVGVQLSQPVGELLFLRGIETFGSEGKSLVKGVMQDLLAIALSVKSGGAARSIRIQGGLKTHGKGISPLEQEGRLESLLIKGGFFSEGG